MAKKNIDMTHGTIWKQLLYFSLPLLVGYLFQQLYNTVDAVVVGNFVGKEALAAVGTTGNVINAVVGFFMGLSTGAGVVLSHYFGARDEKGLHDTVHTTMLLTFLSSLVATALGILLVPTLLNITKTPEDVYPLSDSYLTIYFAGLPGLMIYNMGSGLLRSVGDTRRPLYFLIFSALVNTVLDLLFVAVLGMGVAGVAWATIIAEAPSAILVLIVLCRSKESYRLILRDLRMNREIVSKILQVGVPAGVQAAIISFSNAFVQSYINVFGSDIMAGYSSYSKLDQFIGLPLQAHSMASTTFVGQNVGAKQPARAKAGIRMSMILGLSMTAVLIIPVVIFANASVSLFNSDENVVYWGARFLRYISPFYLLCCINNIMTGAIRGAGESKVPMFITVGSFVVFRQIYLFIGTNYIINTPLFVAMGYPAGWFVCSTSVLLYYKLGGWDKRAGLVK